MKKSAPIFPHLQEFAAYRSAAVEVYKARAPRADYDAFLHILAAMPEAVEARLGMNADEVARILCDGVARTGIAEAALPAIRFVLWHWPEIAAIAFVTINHPSDLPIARERVR